MKLSLRTSVIPLAIFFIMFGVVITIMLTVLDDGLTGTIEDQVEETVPQVTTSHPVVRDPGYVPQSESEPLPEECIMSDSQLDVIHFSFRQGAEYNLSYTLAAIAIKESNAGKWKMNIHDPSGGLYHLTLDKVIRHMGWPDTRFNRNRAMQVIVDDDEMSAELAIKELLFWKEYNSGNWMDIWASYNAGTNGRYTSIGQEYAEDIRKIIRRIELCEWYPPELINDEENDNNE